MVIVPPVMFVTAAPLRRMQPARFVAARLIPMRLSADAVVLVPVTRIDAADAASAFIQQEIVTG